MNQYLSYQTVGTPSQLRLLNTSGLHALEAALVGGVDLGDLVVILLQLGGQLGGVELAVAAAGLDDLGLLVQGEVLPGEAGSDDVAEEGEDLVVRDGAGVGEVVDASLLVLGEEDRGGEEVGEDGVAVGDVDDTLVLGDLGDEVARVEVVRDGHAQAEDQSVGIVLHDL